MEQKSPDSKKLEAILTKEEKPETTEDVEQLYETWTNCMDKLFTVNLVEKLGQLCQLPKEAKERVTYTYESQMGNAKNGFRRRLKAIAAKYKLPKVFADAHEVLNFTLLIAELSKLDTGFSEEELYFFNLYKRIG